MLHWISATSLPSKRFHLRKPRRYPLQSNTRFLPGQGKVRKRKHRPCVKCFPVTDRGKRSRRHRRKMTLREVWLLSWKVSERHASGVWNLSSPRRRDYLSHVARNERSSVIGCCARGRRVLPMALKLHIPLYPPLRAGSSRTWTRGTQDKYHLPSWTALADVPAKRVPCYI